MQRHNVIIKTSDGASRDYTPDEAMMLYRLFKHLYETMHHRAILIETNTKYRAELMDTANYFYGKMGEIQKHIFGEVIGPMDFDETKIDSK